MRGLIRLAGELAGNVLFVLLVTFGWFPLTLAASLGCTYLLRTNLPLTVLAFFTVDAAVALSVWLIVRRRGRRGRGTGAPSVRDAALPPSTLRDRVEAFASALRIMVRRAAKLVPPPAAIQRAALLAALGALALATFAFVLGLLFELRRSATPDQASPVTAAPPPAETRPTKPNAGGSKNSGKGPVQRGRKVHKSKRGAGLPSQGI